jgi:hypothetical protein
MRSCRATFLCGCWVLAIFKALPEADDGLAVCSFVSLCLVDESVRARFDVMSFD